MDFYRWLKLQWDRAAAVGTVMAGLVALIAGWIGVSGKTLPAEQLPYLASGAVFGLFALGIAATLWLSADIRDEWRKLDDLHEDVRGVLRATGGSEGRPAGREIDLDGSPESSRGSFRRATVVSGS